MLVFVYGSLKRGFCNHGLLKDAKFIKHDQTKEAEYRMYSAGAFPMVSNGDKHIGGELYEVAEATLDRLDRLEGHPNWYKREQVYLQGHDAPAWMYVIPEKEVLYKDFFGIVELDNTHYWS